VWRASREAWTIRARPSAGQCKGQKTDHRAFICHYGQRKNALLDEQREE
jgi:hypothetical protein